MATVSVNVVADPNGPIPTAVNDPTTGAINVTAGQSVVINVLANDNANGGVLDPASVVVTAAPAAGTTSVNPANGAITYTAAAAGTFTFQYKVSNTASANGTIQTSNAATVTVTVTAAENLTIQNPAKCSLPNKWQVRGTSNVSVGNTVTIYRGATVPAQPDGRRHHRLHSGGERLLAVPGNERRLHLANQHQVDAEHQDSGHLVQMK